MHLSDHPECELSIYIYKISFTYQIISTQIKKFKNNFQNTNVPTELIFKLNTNILIDFHNMDITVLL